MMIKISVITPCFNGGIYLKDACDSLLLKKHSGIMEHIIVNDGSTDEMTLNFLHTLEKEGCIVVHQENMGLAAARNAGISMARGKYILPLDCDNRIVPDVLLEAVEMMESDDDIDVVYSDAEYFGDMVGKRTVGAFDGIRLLANNYIDACALIRKKALLEVGLYDGAMPAMGTEDWELWIKLFIKGKQFRYLPKVGFYYRVVPDSMSAIHTRPNLEKNRQFIYHKHARSIAEKIFEINHLANSMKQKIDRVNNLNFSGRLRLAVKLFLRGKKVIY